MKRDEWFPSSEPEQVMVVQNIENKIDGYAAQLGLNPPDLVEAHVILLTFLAVVPKNAEIQATAEAFTTFKNLIKDGPEGGAAPLAPVFAPTFLPNGATTGIVSQLRKLRNGWLLKSGYTPEIGMDLMLIGAEQPEPPPSEMQAALKLSQTGDYTTTFTFSKKGMDAVRIEWRMTGTETWHLGGDFTTSPASVTIAPTTPNQPVSVEFRARLMKRNQPVGIWSPIYTAFVTP